MTRYRCVTARKAEGFPVRRACEAAAVSPSAYYDWLNRPQGPTQAEWDEAHLITRCVTSTLSLVACTARRG